MERSDDYFAGAPEHWELPISNKPLNGGLAIWQQHEYVTCVQCGFSFAGHRHGEVDVIWHYMLPTPAGWAFYSVISPGRSAQQVVQNHPGNPFMKKAKR